jgi:hypothetical protein
MKKSLRKKIEAMVEAGLLQWNKKNLKPITPVARTKGKKTVSDLLIEDR